MNFLVVRSRSSLRFLRGEICLYLVLQSTKNKQYQAPPIAFDGLKPMSICQTSPYFSGRDTVFLDLHLLCRVACSPRSTSELVSIWMWMVSSFMTVVRSLINLSGFTCLMDWRRQSLVIFIFFWRDKFGRSSTCLVGAVLTSLQVAGSKAAGVESRFVSSGATVTGMDG